MQAQYDCVFIDPPDNFGLQYDGQDTKEDKLDPVDYEAAMFGWLSAGLDCTKDTGTMWVSFNANHTFLMSRVCEDLYRHDNVKITPMVQTYTFYQHNHHDFGTAHRPLYRFEFGDSIRYPDQIRVKSQRQLSGDKRADPRGKVPGTVFDFPRVVGNAKQRRAWHPTQLHEGLVQRCIESCTKAGDWVLDPMAGTGTVLRVCKKIDRQSTSMDKSAYYCQMMAVEHEMEVMDWSS
jgi:DNA modification methylase